jgi:ribose/xylose/arabinose/galactoside ABC-type transport system permease subunit
MGVLGSPWGQRGTILALVFAVMAVLQPKFFLPANASSILLAISVYGIMACGMLYVVLLGGLDLSMGSMAGLAATILAVFADRGGYSPGAIALGFLAAFAVSVAVGYFHGCLVTHIGMPAFVVTLATKYILYGITPIVSGGPFVYLPSTKTGILYQLGNAKVFGVPLPIVIFLAVAVVCGIILSKTTYGRRLYAVGGNATASSLVGIRVFADTKRAYIVSSVSACVGGILLCSMNMLAGQTTGVGYEGNVLMAMIIGGINLAGGEGGISGAVFGALFAGIIGNMMILLGVGADFQKFVQGVIILAAVSLNVYTKRRGQGRAAVPRGKKNGKGAAK